MKSSNFKMALGTFAVLAMGGVAQAALVSDWTFDETSGTTAVDSVGGINGTVRSDVTVGQTGKIGKAYSFAGTGAADNTGVNVASYTARSASYTLSVWFKTSNFSGSETVRTGAGALVGWTGGGLSELFVEQQDVKHQDANANWSTAWSEDKGNFTNDAWHLATVTRSSGNYVTLYVDGSPLGGVQSVSPLYGVTTFVMGFRDSTDWRYAGLMDDVSLWSDTLTATQAKSLYSLGDKLMYNAGNVDSLLSAYAAQNNVMINGSMWRYVASGLSGDPGVVTSNDGFYSLNLGGGAGMSTIPEPSVAMLLGAGLVGLCSCARRKR